MMRSTRSRTVVWRTAQWAALLTTAIALLACAPSSGLVDAWRDPAYRRPAANMLILVMHHDALQRRRFEDAFVTELRKRGVDASPSYRLFPRTLPDTDALTRALAARHYETALVAHRLETETQRRYVPGYVTTQPVTVENPWTGRYHYFWAEVQHPGYFATDTIVRYTAEVWTTGRRGRLVWTGTTETFNPSSPRDLERQVSHVIVPELARQGIVAMRRLSPVRPV